MSDNPVTSMTVRRPDGSLLPVKGRLAWALNVLIERGAEGVTPITAPAPRWSAYVHKIKREHGIAIETVTEGHRGAFAGTHARYVLRTPLEVVTVERGAA